MLMPMLRDNPLFKKSRVEPRPFLNAKAQYFLSKSYGALAGLLLFTLKDEQRDSGSLITSFHTNGSKVASGKGP